MSNQAPAQEQSAPTPTTPTSASPQQSPADALQDKIATARMTNQPDLASALETELVQLLAPKPAAESQPPAEPKEQQTQETAPEAQVEAEAHPEAEVETPAAESEEKPESKRFRFEDPADRRFATLRKEGVPPDEAARIAYGLGNQPEPDPEPEAPQVPAEITNLETEVADLEKQLDDAGAAEGVFDQNVAKITAKLSKANAKLEAAKTRYESAANTQTVVSESEFNQQRHGRLVAIAKEYPQMTDKNSPQWTLARDLALAAANPDHPDHQESIGLNAPAFFAKKAATILQIKPTGAAPSTPPAKPTPSSPAAPKPGAPKPAPGSLGTAPQPQIGKEQILAAADHTVMEALAGRGTATKATRPYIMMGR